VDGLHWTGAALLLAVAVLGGRAAPVARQPIVSWRDFARAHGIDADEHSASATYRRQRRAARRRP
jgi:hypothetical protein